MKIEIKSWLNGSVLFQGDFSCLAAAVMAAVKFGVNLSGADLSGADLSGVNLSGVNLSGVNLSGADLSRANLSRADLSAADLSGADLSRANLSRANLYAADLSRANLSRANLSRADLYGADLYAYAQVSFRGHGECGRLLAAIQQTKESEVRFYCGCFRGTGEELKTYIDSGEPRLKQTRTVAMETVLMLLKQENPAS